MQYCFTPFTTDFKTQAKASQLAAKESSTGRRPSIEIKDPDLFLCYLGDILHRIHAKFYSLFNKMSSDADLSTMSNIPTPDLKQIIPEMRLSVLKGAKILFTGVIPTNVPPQRSPEWNTARAFGATIHDQLVPGLESSNQRAVVRATTHVVAGKTGTVKLKDARRVAGVKIVNPRWLWSCAEQWKWLDEKLFPVEAEESSKEGKRDESSEKGKRKNSKDEPLKEQKAHISQEKQPTQQRARQSSRLVSLESRISVSDEELEKMEAEVEAEIGSSSGSSSSEEDSQQVKQPGARAPREKDSSSDSTTRGVVRNNKCVGRKRKRAELEGSDQLAHSESSSSDSSSSNISDDSADELATLLEK